VYLLELIKLIAISPFTVKCGYLLYRLSRKNIPSIFRE
jgi:hypothetical protein